MTRCRSSWYYTNAADIPGGVWTRRLSHFLFTSPWHFVIYPYSNGKARHSITVECGSPLV